MLKLTVERINLYTDVLQDFVFFIPPPPHYQGSTPDFSPSLDSCWYGRVKLIFSFRVKQDDGTVMECQCAFIETLYPFCEGHTKTWWPSTARIGTRMFYLPSPDPVVYVVPLSHILGKLPLVPAGDMALLPIRLARTATRTAGIHMAFVTHL